jgi:hypothetical protein
LTNANPHRRADAWTLFAGLLVDEGSARHLHVRRLLAPRAARRDLADAVHAICSVYGHQPGMADEALARCVQPDACDWLSRAAAGFADERAALVHLVAGAGPLPSTPGQAESEAALAGVRHAVEMLARSDRGGCATGAVVALVEDWVMVRRVLDRAADCFAVALPPATLPDATLSEMAVATLAASPAPERAMMFGAHQLLAQNRGLWDLLEARASARG